MAKRIGVDKWIFFTSLTLVVVGLAMVFSASAIVAQERFHSPYAFVGRQAGWALAGVLLMVFLMSVDYAKYNTPRFIFTALAITTVLLVMVYFFRDSHATHRWIRFGSLFTFQPSEIAKPVLILFLAWFLSKRLDTIDDWRHTLVRAAIMPVVFILLIVKQPDLGTALVLAGVTAMMLMLAGMEWKYLVAAIAVALPPLAALLFWVPWRRARMLAFAHPDLDPQGAGFHINQSLIAVGTGGLTGRGFMEGMQKLFYLPEASTDFIFANVAEELGFLGAMCIVVLFCVLGYRGLRTAYRSTDPFARLTAFGITTAILLQAFFNISVVLSLLPTKGIPLPFISSGGTSLFFTLASIGILLNISKKVD
ncbi:MAG TPA: putative lipid II flippase FtsW [Terracidiphilus sp.]|jgi:cell division protein FtsW|nr:putative lipid II flippase FtsW [Terracidiphilus sp.]